MINEPIPENALLLVERIADALQLDHAGFDIAMIGDHPYIFEFNRLFGHEGLTAAGIKPGEIIFDYLQRRQNRLNSEDNPKGRRDDPETPDNRILT